ncbi:hypothetical protein ACLQ26_27770 [Micromonospora sp. DT43]|uniref:hypothetical protein n=1 Tax=Micromonospora sp. DT43 TaxID=3393440 RepID=UPI003CF97E8B
MRRARLVLDCGPYPLSATRVGGIGLRVAEFAETLAGRHDVTVLAGDPYDHIDVGAARVAGPEAWPDVLADSQAAFFFDLADPARLADAVRRGVVVVTENAPPIEHLEYPSLRSSADPAGDHARIVAAYAEQLRHSDHFLCRSAIEHTTLVANLCLAGRLRPADLDRSRTLDHLATTVPIGFSAGSAARADRAETRPVADLLWTGGLWSFFEPLAAIDAVAYCRAQGRRVSLCFLYGAPQPDNAALLGAMHDRIAARELGDRVTIRRDPLPHDERDGLLKGARALVAVAKPGIENETCVRLRIRDSRLHALPMITDPHGPTARELAEDGTGTAVDPTDVPALGAAFLDSTTGDDNAKYRYRCKRYCYEESLAPFLGRLDRLVHDTAGRR